MSTRRLVMAKAKLSSETGIRCRSCSAPVMTRIIDSRGNADGSSIRRRRVCPACGDRFSTYELAAHPGKAALIANIRTAHLDVLIGALKNAITEYEYLRLHPVEAWAEPID